jgi:hypothetical protein
LNIQTSAPALVGALCCLIQQTQGGKKMTRTKVSDQHEILVMDIEEAKSIVKKEAYRIYQAIGYEVFGDSSPDIEDVRDVTADCFEAHTDKLGRKARQLLIWDGSFEETVEEGLRR